VTTASSLRILQATPHTSSLEHCAYSKDYWSAGRLSMKLACEVFNAPFEAPETLMDTKNSMHHGRRAIYKGAVLKRRHPREQKRRRRSRWMALISSH
jgi:hypothetical protein